MAETTQEATARRPKPKAGAAAPAAKASTTQTISAKGARATTPAASAAVPTVAAPPKAASRFGFFRGLGGRKDTAQTPAETPKGATATNGAADMAAKPQRPANPSMGRFFLGMALYMVLAFAAQFVLNFIFSKVHGGGQNVLFTLPLLGPVTTYLFVWMLTLIAILYGLYKFKILPRTLGQPRQKMAVVKADPKAAKPAAEKAPREPLSGPNDDAYVRVKARLSAERRKARRR